jgi:hypothetical protein
VLARVGGGGIGGLAANGGGDVATVENLFSVSSFATNASLCRVLSNKRTHTGAKLSGELSKLSIKLKPFSTKKETLSQMNEQMVEDDDIR